MYFYQLPIGSNFYCNGNLCLKRTTRTALLCEFDRVFYFSKKTFVQPVKG